MLGHFAVSPKVLVRNEAPFLDQSRCNVFWRMVGVDSSLESVL